MELLIDHVSKQFKDKTAVNDISLELTPGVWGLLGANGAGKTTLMRMIAGIMQPTSGRVVYDGVPIQELGEQYRSIFGFLPQDFGFHPEFTVKDYLAYVAALKGLPERQSRRKIHELLERVSLLDVSGKKISKLSGGMRRRVGIAQALLNDPEVLILDEPTGGLDPGERVRFRNLLSEFAHDRIVLISTHIVPDVEYIATCHAIIKGGKLLATGTTEEGVYEEEILPIAPLLHGVKEAFADPDTGMAPTIMEIDPAQIDDYYSVCETRIASLMAMEQPDSPAVQRKAVEMYRRVEKPFAVYPSQ